MKIPEGQQMSSNMWDAWYNMAARLSLKHNVFIAVSWDKETIDKLGNCYRSCVYFVVEGHRFDSLVDLLKALKLKAFL